MDFYLKGNKGLAAARALFTFPNVCSNVFLLKDNFTSAKRFAEVFDKLQSESYNILELTSSQGIEYSNTALLVGWDRMVDTTNKDIFVIHDSILPKLRGWNPLVSALIAGEREIGATLFKADSGADSGPIIKSQSIHIQDFITISEAMRLVEPLITSLTKYLLESFEELNYQTQVEALATYSMWRDHLDYCIDFSNDAAYILRHILASGEPYAGARSWIGEEEVIITGARIVEDLIIANRTPGKVIAIKNGNPIVVCGSGMLEITEAKYKNSNIGFFPFTKIKSRFSSIRSKHRD
jgi:methionyl-tRNA formyltransferase